MEVICQCAPDAGVNLIEVLERNIPTHCAVVLANVETKLSELAKIS
jgi:hypothetical protein